MRASATAFPMPVPAPVTSATLCDAAMGWSSYQLIALSSLHLPGCNAVVSRVVAQYGERNNEATRGAGARFDGAVCSVGGPVPGHGASQISRAPDPAGHSVPAWWRERCGRKTLGRQDEGPARHCGDREYGWGG